MSLRIEESRCGSGWTALRRGPRRAGPSAEYASVPDGPATGPCRAIRDRREGPWLHSVVQVCKVKQNRTFEDSTDAFTETYSVPRHGDHLICRHNVCSAVSGAGPRAPDTGATSR